MRDKIQKLERDLFRASLDLTNASTIQDYAHAIHRYNSLNSRYVAIKGRPYDVREYKR